MARLFDNASSESLTTLSAVVSAQPFTVSVGFNSDTFAAVQNLWAFSEGEETDNDMFRLQIQTDGALLLVTKVSGSFKTSATSTTASTNTDHHAAYVAAASNSRSVYLDGAGKATNTNEEVPLNIDFTELAKVNNNGTDANFLSGSLAEWAVWDIALTDAQIAELALGYSPLMIAPANLVQYMDMVRDDDVDIIGGVAFTANNTPGISRHPRMIYPASPQVITVPAAAAATRRYGLQVMGVG